MSVLFDFSGKVALITGSSSGIGAATALLFAKYGANVVITGRNAENVKSVAKQCSDVSPNKLIALEVVADITKNEDLDRLVKTTIATFGKIDVLVNNAGAEITANISDENYFQRFTYIMNTNLNSIVYLTHICVQYLGKTKGNVVNISSVLSTQTNINRSGYCMSKAALDMFTKCMAVELGHKGIRVNCINLGMVRTNILRVNNINIDERKANEIWDSFGPKYPVGRCGEGIDIANSVLYLASEQASFITGSLLLDDGGHLAANVTLGGI